MTGGPPDQLLAAGAVLAAVGSLVPLLADGRRTSAARRRSEALLGLRRRRGPRMRLRRPRARALTGPLCTAVACAALLEGVAGPVVGLVAGAALHAALRRRSRAGPASVRATGTPAHDGPASLEYAARTVPPEEAARQLPLAADLLAACLSAGAGPREAAQAVGESLGGAVGGCLAAVTAQLRLGREPAEAWAWLGAALDAEALARCLERADATGSPAAEPTARTADLLRAARARRAVAHGRRAQVRITAPVGLCFLPAFLAIGVAPVLIGLAGGLLRSA
ncbi:type II secretion system F family protein [Streptomyces sanyensis]|uniref:type II secretion system F family protein n=1 Tax=Streptomyces sanyensis TaxID=568869 RepID=UPI003D776D42